LASDLSSEDLSEEEDLSKEAAKVGLILASP